MGKKSKELGGDVRQMIIESYRSNKNISELSRIFRIPRRTVGSVIKKFHEFGSRDFPGLILGPITGPFPN